MKIGYITQEMPYLPSKDGFRLYAANILAQLSKSNTIDLITLLRPSDKEHLDWLSAHCSTVNFIPVQTNSMPAKLENFASMLLRGRPTHYVEQIQRAVTEGLKNGSWDVLYSEGAFVAGLIDETLPMAKVLSVHDAGGLRAQEMLKCDLDFRTRLEYSFRKYTDPRYERLVYPRFDSVVVVSERDASYLRRLVPGVNFTVIPNGVDTEYFSPCEVPKDENVVVFHGNLSYSPNVDAVLEFSDQILPLVRQAVPSVRFRVVGSAPTKEVRALESRVGIEVLADLPDLRPALSSANVYACAVRFGTGVKNKVLEAMALRLPMVAYEPGSTSGIDCENGKHLLTAHNREEFASKVIDLLCHSEKAQQTAFSARELVCSKYSWETRAKAFEELFVTARGRVTGNRRAGISSTSSV